MPTRPCPVCRVGKVLRRDIRTCSVSCSREWNTWSREQQGSAIEDSYISIEEITQRAAAEGSAEVSEEEAERQRKMRIALGIEKGEANKSDMPQSLMTNLSKKETPAESPEPQVLSEQEQRELRRKQMAEALGVKTE